MSADRQTRRELKRHYREAGPRPGVYAIRNLNTGWLLVDGASDPQAALNRHAFELRLRRHRNRALQRDWDAAGADGFVFEVLDVVPAVDDPAIDVDAELRALIMLWREELGCNNVPG